MVITFPIFSTKHPVGGVMAVYEFAGGMARLGHEVHVVHCGCRSSGIGSLDDIAWVRLEGAIQHHFFPGGPDEGRLPEADFLFCFSARTGQRRGRPLTFVQGYTIFPKEIEDRVYRFPCPKICTATWLVDIGKQLGVPEQQLVHIPYGLRHEKYRLITPIDNRPLRVSMVHSNHPQKGARCGLAALERVKHKFPGLDVVVFGTQDPDQPIPPGITFVKSPDQSALVEQIYNKSRVFVMPSLREGFGLPCIEAMACGCAVVTTSNGGSRDYAIHKETALVSKPRNVDAMASQIARLLKDEKYRVELASRGHEYVKRFSWDTSARSLEAFLKAYAESPEYYQRAT